MSQTISPYLKRATGFPHLYSRLLCPLTDTTRTSFILSFKAFHTGNVSAVPTAKAAAVKPKACIRVLSLLGLAIFSTKTSRPSQSQKYPSCLSILRSPCPSSSSFRSSSAQSVPCPRQKTILLFPFYLVTLIIIIFIGRIVYLLLLL